MQQNINLKIRIMKKLLLLLSIFALFAVGKTSAATGDVITGYVTHIDKSGTSHSVEMLFQISDQTNKFVRIYGYENDEGIYNSLSLYAGDYMGEIIVPEKIGDYTVKSVGGWAFYKCEAKITLPESVTELEDNAFRGYGYNGYDFALPSKVRYIGICAFAAAKIKGISLPNTLKNIDNYAFSGCYLRELVLPNSIFNIGDRIMADCYYLERLEVENGCANYTTPAGSNVIMDTKLYTILAGCKNSKIPAEARRIARGVFYGTRFTNPVITIPESVGFIGEKAFVFSNVNKLIIKSETVDIQTRAFVSCESLEHIYVYGNNLTIGPNAFRTCTKLIDMYCYSHKPKLTELADGYPGNAQFVHIGPNWEFGNSKVLLYAKYPDEYNDKFFDGDLIWQNWFKEVLPLPESKIISEVHLTDYDWPVATQTADYTITSLTEHATVEVSYARWTGESWVSETPTTFSLNSKYNIIFTVTLNDGYTFGDNPKAYINDQAIDHSTISATPTQQRFVAADYIVPAPPGGVPITMVYARVAEPVAGQPLSTTVTSPVGRDAKYYNWVIDSVFWAHGADASLDSYDPTKAYTLVALFTAKQNYCFGTDCTFTLNGKDASVIRSRTADGRERVMLAVAYGNEEPVPEPIDISSVNITVADPVEGEEFPTEVVNPTPEAFEGLDYSLTTVRWYNADKPFDVGDPGSLATGTYDPTKDYRIFVSIRGKYNCRILEGLNATINDRQAATLVFSSYIEVEEYEGYEYTAVLVAEYPATVKRGDVNGDGDVNSADVVAIYAYIIEGDASGYTKEAADVDGSGDVNSADVVAVYDIIINGDKE